MAGERGITVALENEPICFGATGQGLARLLDEIDHPAVGANWDPGNYCTSTGQDFRAGYAPLRGRIVHVHVKDQAFDADGTRRTVPAGDGRVDWAGQIDALLADGYSGLMVVETHFGPRVAASRASVEALCGLLAAAGEDVQ